MALAVAGIKTSKPLLIKNYNVVNKSYPNFWKDFEKINKHE
jgi:3-phosphoshikimate 1-carboxyvinyltransferase